MNLNKPCSFVFRFKSPFAPILDDEASFLNLAFENYIYVLIQTCFMKYSHLFRLGALALTTFIFFIACQKEVNWTDGPVTPFTPPDLTTRINSSVSGFVTDENNQPVQNASVNAGSVTVSTDEYGFFEIRNVSVVKNAATVTITKNGYFKSIKTYTAVNGKSAFFRVKLIPNSTSGTINAGSGGTVTLSNGFSITLPPAAVVNATTNAAYTGTINVAAYWINPAGNEVANLMPGDLRGLDTTGAIRLLASFGMASVELTGASGEKLQIATGKKAKLNFPVPVSLQSKAPASIPLWYFDETSGLWKQEGSASKSGNNYSGDVSHFTLWNVDDPSNFVIYDCTVVNTNGQPVPYVYVKVTDGFFYTYGYTDSSGYVNGYVPKNKQLTLEIYDNVNCPSPVYTQAFTTTTSNISLGTITIPLSSARIATLTGAVKNCNNAAVTSGFIIINDGNILNRYTLSSSGTYSVNKIFCSFPAVISFIGEDVAAGKQSNPVSFSVTSSGVQNVPDIIACAQTTQEYLNYTDNGVPAAYSAPVDTLYWYATPPPVLTATITARTIPIVPNNYATITFSNSNVTVGSVMAVSAFSTFSSNSYLLNSGTITITEYGAVGQFVAGNFTVTKSDITNGQLHTFTGSLRIRRTN